MVEKGILSLLMIISVVTYISSEGGKDKRTEIVDDFADDESNFVDDVKKNTVFKNRKGTILTDGKDGDTRLNDDDTDSKDGGTGSKGGETVRKGGGTGLKDGGVGSKDGGTVKKDGGTVKKDGGTGLKDGGTGSKDGGTARKAGGTARKDGGTVRKDGGTGLKDGGVGSKDGGTVRKDSGTGSKDGGTVRKNGGTGSKDGGTVEKDGDTELKDDNASLKDGDTGLSDDDGVKDNTNSNKSANMKHAIDAGDLSDEVYVVKLSHGGQIRGSISRRYQGRLMHSFEGIPFAEPPVGELRFRPPVPKAEWGREILDATDYGRMCVQIDDETAASLVGDEDCLFLNVYTPQLSNETYNPKLPVMVFFHGGGFVFGDGGLYGAGRFLDEDVIVVTCNYRIGPLGFLSTNDDESRGNYGLMDQLLVLQWVQENIQYFGGDKKHVTIFGEGAGGASVIYHILSPKSEGLFQNAIAMSGSPLSPWAFQQDPLIWALRLAADCNCSTDTSAQVVSCLRYNTSADTIVQLANQFMVWGNLPYLYVPSLDGTFLTEHPRKTMTSGPLPKQVRLMTGVNKDGGILYYMGIYQRLADTVKRFLSSKENIEFIVNYLLDDQKKANEASKLVVEKYFASVDLNDAKQNRDTLIKIISHAMFDVWHYETAQLLSRNGMQTYVYSLDYSPSQNFANLFGFEELKDGVSQGDELFLLFDGILFGDYDPTKKDVKMIDVLRTLWTNFAKHTDPTPRKSDLLPLDWKPSSKGKIHVYHINETLTMTSFNPAQDELFKFWTGSVFNALPHTEVKKELRDEL